MFASKLEWWHFYIINIICCQRCFLAGKFRKINLPALLNYETRKLFTAIRVSQPIFPANLSETFA
ncbi:hypothetical protein NSP_40060 [Nodularia spumigena CCY9414]|nr:hypothetical protein NSP_40060 [Nodularia spumigena CCY9414]